MLEQLKYKNHLNEVFEFGKDGIYINTNDLHNYTWTVTQKGNRISGFNYGIQTRTLPVIIMCDTAEKGISARNMLLEVVEKDVKALQYGQIIIGDYYFRCFVTGSSKAEYLINKRYITISLTLTSDSPYWVKETSNAFNSNVAVDGGLDYPFDHSFNYPSSASISTLTNTGFVPSDFRLIIYGPCTNPYIIVGDHNYKVNCVVNSGEYLTIDSVGKKIYLTELDGTTVNKFNDRDKTSYIFEKIPSGKSPVAWDGEYCFDLILLEERSEPKWT